MSRRVRQEAIHRSESWWWCDNIVNHPGQLGLLRMDFPQVFILIRDDNEDWDFDQFKNQVAEVNFFNPSDREGADIDSILIDAWNFMLLQEEEEENQAAMRELEDEGF